MKSDPGVGLQIRRPSSRGLTNCVRGDNRVPLGDIASLMSRYVAALQRTWSAAALLASVPLLGIEAQHGWSRTRLEVSHAEIALMPEGTPENYDLFQPLRPSIVAWGEDAIGVLDGGKDAADRVRGHMEAYRALGVTQIATNVWMLTATERFLFRHPELADTACVDLWGEKIVPRWLADADFKGAKPWWGCTNQPRYQDHLLARLRAGLQGGATLVHLDDHSGTLACAAGAGGCFCSYCQSGFRAWLSAHVSPAELAREGVPDVEHFDYRAFLLQRHYPDRKGFIAASWKGDVPLWHWFLAYQRDAAIDFIGRMQSEAARIAGHPVPFGVNAYDLQPKQLFDAHVIDYFANEVEQFGKEDLVPPVVYRLGETLGRPVFATGTGEDWIAYRQQKSVNRVRGWIAEAYAFGQYFMYSWKKWGFSERTGTLWTEVDPGVFAPMCAFIHGHPELFDGFENAATVGLLYDNAVADKNHWGVREASRALLNAGVPYRLLISGDDLLKHPLTRDALASVRVIVIPGDVAPDRNSAQILSEWQKHGGRIYREPVREASAFAGRIEVTGGGHMWALPRVKPASGSAADRAVVAIHLLNRDYDAQTDTFQRKRDVTLTIDTAALGGPTNVTVARYYRPNAPTQELVARRGADGRITCVVPELEIWGVILIGAPH